MAEELGSEDPGDPKMARPALAAPLLWESWRVSGRQEAEPAQASPPRMTAVRR